MSDLEEAEDKALRVVPWLAKTISNQLYLFKYAHVTNKSSLFLLTTLDKVYYESLTTSRLISRASASVKLTQEASQLSSLGVGRSYGDSQSQSIGMGTGSMGGEDKRREAALKSCLEGLDGMFRVGEGWEEVDVELGDQDIIEDLAINLSTDNFAWTMKLTKLPDSQSLRVLRDHLFFPLLGSYGCATARLSEVEGGVVDLAAAIDTSSSTAIRRLAPLMKSTMNKPVVQSSMLRWSQGREQYKPLTEVVEEYTTEQSDTLPNAVEDSLLVPAAKLEQFSFPASIPSRPPLLNAASSSSSHPLHASPISGTQSPQDLPLTGGQSEEDLPDWNSDMTEPESDDEEARSAYLQAKERTLQKRAEGKAGQAVKANAKKVALSDGEDVDMDDDRPPPSPSYQNVKGTQGRKRRSSGSPERDRESNSVKRTRNSMSPSPAVLSDTSSNVNKEEEAEKRRARAQAIRDALVVRASDEAEGESGPASSGAPTTGTQNGRGAASRGTATRGRARGRGRSVW